MRRRACHFPHIISHFAGAIYETSFLRIASQGFVYFVCFVDRRLEEKDLSFSIHHLTFASCQFYPFVFVCVFRGSSFATYDPRNTRNTRNLGKRILRKLVSHMATAKCQMIYGK